MSTRDKVLSSILGLLILAAISATVYVVTSSLPWERYTEFYILGLDNKAIDYPKELAVGEEGKVIVGIANHEYQEVHYQVVLRIGEVGTEVGPIVLKQGEVWEEIVSFIPHSAGDNQKVEFLLYISGETEPYLEQLYLRIDVVQ